MLPELEQVDKYVSYTGPQIGSAHRHAIGVVQPKTGVILLVDGKNKAEGLALPRVDIAYNRGKEDRSGHPVNQWIAFGLFQELRVALLRNARQPLLKQCDQGVQVARSKRVEQVGALRAAGALGVDRIALRQLEQVLQKGGRDHLVDLSVCIDRLPPNSVFERIAKAECGHDYHRAQGEAQHDKRRLHRAPRNVAYAQFANDWIAQREQRQPGQDEPQSHRQVERSRGKEATHRPQSPRLPFARFVRTALPRAGHA